MFRLRVFIHLFSADFARMSLSIVVLMNLLLILKQTVFLQMHRMNGNATKGVVALKGMFGGAILDIRYVHATKAHVAGTFVPLTLTGQGDDRFLFQADKAFRDWV